MCIPLENRKLLLPPPPAPVLESEVIKPPLAGTKENARIVLALTVPEEVICVVEFNPAAVNIPVLHRQHHF